MLLQPIDPMDKSSWSLLFGFCIRNCLRERYEVARGGTKEMAARITKVV